MKFRLTSKEILAKLMATENILVEHSNIPTAAFDLINRKLFLPNWKDISDDVYTLLISHEVGHALFTPKLEWEAEVMKPGDAALKQVVNIIEDVRIEKMIQQKYPGTVRAFKAGYDELEKSNLFGTKERAIDSYGLMDRLNLHFKIGHFGYAQVPFADHERPWLDKIGACKTFDDVLRVARELKQYIDENPDAQPEDKSGEKTEQDGSSTQSENSIASDGQLESSSQSPLSSEQKSRPDDRQSASNQNSASGGGSSQVDDQDADTDAADSDSDPNSKSISETQRHFDESIKKLIDESAGDTQYVNLPKLQLDKLIVPYKKVHEQLTTYYSTYFSHVYSDVDAKIDKFRAGSKTVVNQLANIFEMKKRARLDIKALTATTGKLDTNKVHSYRYNDDIFKKLTVVPQGKSHGLVMFIDMSSSMHDSIAGTFEQLLNLVLFCRRASIPFDVYGFTDSYSARGELSAHPITKGDLAFDSRFCLRQYFSSKMTGVEFNRALGNIICVMQHYSGELYAGLPIQESLNTTPLIPAILCATEIVKTFRKENSLDIVNTVFLTDGEDTHGLMYGDGSDLIQPLHSGPYYHGSSNGRKCRRYVRDLSSRKQWEITRPTADMLNILRETTGVKVIGFHLIRRRDAQSMIMRHVRNEAQERHLNSFKNEKFCELSSVPGYDAYYLLPSGHSLHVSTQEFQSEVDDTIDWDDDKSAKRAIRAVAKDFSNYMKQRVTSRILLNRFIEHIS